MPRISIIVFVFFFIGSGCSQRTMLVDYGDIDYKLLDTLVVLGKDPALDSPPEYQSTYERHIDVLHMDLALEFDWEEESIMGRAELLLTPLFYPVRRFRLDAVGFNFFRILTDSNRRFSYDYDSSSLWINLEDVLLREDTLLLSLEYEVQPSGSDDKSVAFDQQGLYFVDPDRSIARLPSQIWSQGQTQYNSRWFPTIDRPVERFTQRITLTVDSNYVTLSNGIKTSSADLPGGRRKDVWVLDKEHPPYLTMIAIGEYAVVSDSSSVIPLTFYVEKGFEEDAAAIFGHSSEMVSFFGSYLGVKFPWDTYSQIVVRNYVSGAMENTTASVFGEFVQRPKKVLLDRNNDVIVAHELFHQWFGDYVTCESWSNLTLNEGFATFSEYLWQEHAYGKPAADRHRKDALNHYIKTCSLSGVHPLIHFYYKDKESMFDAHSYEKGGLVLIMLRELVGESAFRASLQTYLKDNALQSVEVHHLRLAFEKVTGLDLNWFFNQWFLSSGHPELNVYSREVGSQQLQVIIEQHQKGQNVPEVFRLNTSLWLLFADGHKKVFPIEINEKKEVITLDIKERPVSIVFDPSFSLLAEVNDKNLIKDSMQLFLYGPNTVVKEKMVSPGLVEDLSLDQLKALLNETTDPYLLSLILSYLEPDVAVDLKERLISLLHSSQHPSLSLTLIQLLYPMDNKALKNFCLSSVNNDMVSARVTASCLYILKKENVYIDSARLSALEASRSSAILSSLASYYAEGSDNHDGFFLDALYWVEDKDFISFTQKMKEYLLMQNTVHQQSFLNLLFENTKHSSSVYERLGAGKVLAFFSNLYRSKGEESTAETLRNKVLWLQKQESFTEVKRYYSMFLN